MDVLKSCPKHNMVAYMEKTNGNTEFHDIISFLMRSSIHNTLTISPVVSTTFVEQFWMSAKSKIINNVRYITAKVAGKPVSISEASIRSDLLFDDADGIDYLPNQAIFDAIQLMGYEGDLTVLTFNKALFSPQWRFLFHTMNHCISSKSTSWDQIPTNIATALKNVPMPSDHFPINALTSKVFSFMVKKGKHFSGNVTPLFDSMLVHPTKDGGATLERQSELQPTPSPPHLKSFGGNHEAKEIEHLKAYIKKLKKKAKPVIAYHKAWVKSVSMKQRLAGKKSLKKLWIQKESVSKQGRKPAKVEPTVHKDPAFDKLADDTLDYMETEDAQDMGRTRYVVYQEEESVENEVSTKNVLSIDKPKVSTDKEKVSTDKEKVSTDKPKVSTDKEEVSTDKPDEVLIIMSQNKEKLKEKEKGVELKDVEESERPRPTSTRSLLTLKPLPKIDPKEKGKKDEEMARKVQEDWEAEEEVKKLAEEEAIKATLSNEYYFIHARLNANKILAEKL
ncbi:hypothetical protein Tco_1018265 [Tanacetum coccineum]|uniref:Xylulose kinase-1 n=1 Tax=Tanacetum coccineum TaxID=301880 RepID=A0ABQ5FTU5_9ASTR